MEKNSEKETLTKIEISDEQLDPIIPIIAARIVELYKDKNYNRRFKYRLNKKKNGGKNDSKKKAISKWFW